MKYKLFLLREPRFPLLLKNYEFFFEAEEDLLLEEWGQNSSFLKRGGAFLSPEIENKFLSIFSLILERMSSLFLYK